MINRIFVTTHRLGTASLMLEDLKLYGNLWSLPAGPIAFAIGGEHRTEHETDQPDALTASGQTTGSPNLLSTKGGRDVWSSYWEVRVPVTSPAWNCPGLYSLELGYQERFDNYSDFGSTEKPKVFFRWQPIDSSLTLRGTYNEAYHAPTLGELYTLQVDKTVLVGDPATVLPGDPLGRTPGTPLTPPDTVIKGLIGGNPNLKPEVAYEWTYGVVWTPAKVIRGLTLSADFYHIDLRNATLDRDANTILVNNFESSTGTLPNGAPTGGIFSDQIQRDPVTGAVLNVNAVLQNVNRIITEGLDYEASYQLDTSIFSHGDFGRFTFTFNGNYLARYLRQGNPESRKQNFDNLFLGPRLGSLPQNRWYTSVFYDLGGLDAGATVHFIGQMSNLEDPAHKIREWTTLDLIVNYTFNLPASAAQNEVAGYARDGGKNTELKDGEAKSVMPVSTAEYNPCGWRAWLNNTTITLGMNNLFDERSSPGRHLSQGRYRTARCAQRHRLCPEVARSYWRATINENLTNGGDGRTEVNLRGILPKETLVLQDGRRLAPVGFAGDTVDLNMFPFGLIDHIDILKDGASAIYGSDAVDGVFNVSRVIHRFRGVEIYASYGNTNLGFANDMGEERAYLLAGTGDDKTDIVVYAELYNRSAIYSRDADISRNADFTPFGGEDLRSSNYAGRVEDFVYQPSLNGGALSPTPHAFPNAFNDPQYAPLFSLPRKQQAFNFNALTPAMASVDREYLYGSLDTKVCGQYLELFGDFKYVRGFWDGARAPPTFTPDVFTDATNPFGISPAGISVPIQNPFNPFTVPDYTSPGGVDPKFPATQVSAAPPGTEFTERGCVTVDWKQGRLPTRLRPITTNSPADSKVIWASSAITLRLGTGKVDSAIMKTSASSALAGSWTTMRCAPRYSTPIRQPPQSIRH